MSDKRRWEYVKLIDYDGHSIRNDLYHKPEEPASYIIWKEGDQIYAKDGHTGQIPFKGKDVATVIQSAIDALVDGGRILVKRGTYPCSNTINLKEKVTLEGEGIEATILNFASDVDGINIGPRPEGRYSAVKNLWLVAPSGSTKTAINITTDKVLVENVRGDGWDIGVDMSGDCWTNIFRWVHMIDVTNRGFNIHGRANALSLYSCTATGDANATGVIGFFFGGISSVDPFYGLFAYGLNAEIVKMGIRIYSVHLAEINGAFIEITSEDDAHGIIIDNNSGNEAIRINGAHILGKSSSDNNYGITTYRDNVAVANLHLWRLYRGVFCGYSRMLIEGPIYFDDVTYKFMQEDNARILNVADYVTENHGIATIPNGSSSVVVDHGLAKAPSVVKLTGTHSEVANCWVTNPTSTQFTINAPAAVTADRDVYWQAEV